MLGMFRTEKLKLFDFGEAMKLKCFKGITFLPIDYGLKKNAWMTSLLSSV